MKPELTKEELAELEGLRKELPTPPPCRWQAVEFDNPVDFIYTIRPGIKLHKWQREELLRLAGYARPTDKYKLSPTDKNPLYYNLVAANGSGKDAMIISIVAVWFAISKIRSRTIITSSSHEQLKNQTFKFITDLCVDVNDFFKVKLFDIVEFYIKSATTGSEIKGFVTDEAGKAEGYHPFPDYPGAEMMVICNEAKSIPEELFEAFHRFTGYNYWLEISSPGGATGHFFKRSAAGIRCPEPLQLGKFYTRTVTAFECPHISRTHIEMMKAEYGESHALYRSSILAEFTSATEQVVIPDYVIKRIYGEVKDFTPPKKNTFGRNFAGLDFGAGSAETVLAVCNGNTILGFECLVAKETDKTCRWLLEMFRKWDLRPEDVNADDNGVGRGMVGNLTELGWSGMNLLLNQSPAHDKTIYGNLGAEMWFKFGRFIQDINFSEVSNDLILRQQLAGRYYVVKAGVKTYLEDKKEAAAKGHVSPDRADALVLAWATKPYDWLKSGGDFKASPEVAKIDIAAVQRQMEEERNERLFIKAPQETGTYRAGYNASGSLSDLIKEYAEYRKSIGNN